MAGALLYALFRLVPLEEVAAQLRGARLWALPAVLALTFAALAVCALKLCLLVRTGAPHVRFLGVLRAYYVGIFFNNFLPTSIGGDVVKMHRLTLRGVSLAHATASVIVERATGVMVVIAAAGAVALGWPGLMEALELSAVRWPLVALSAGFFLGLAIAYALWQRHLKGWLRARREGRLTGKLYAFAESLYLFRSSPGLMAWTFAISALFYLIVAANTALVAYMLRADLGLGRAIGLIPLARLPEMLPISLGGLGVREGAITWCLAHLGPSAAQAAGVAIVQRFMNWVHSAIGGLLYATDRRGRPSSS